jgi:hypothetical protein
MNLPHPLPGRGRSEPGPPRNPGRSRRGGTAARHYPARRPSQGRRQGTHDKGRTAGGRQCEIEDLFYAEGSPLASSRLRFVRKEPQPRDLGHEFFRSLRQDEYDVGVSSSGADAAEAGALVEALRTAGLMANWYRTATCRAGDRVGVLAFMKSLSRQPCVIFLLSEAHLRNDPVQNWYCAWVLEDAIQRPATAARQRPCCRSKTAKNRHKHGD